MSTTTLRSGKIITLMDRISEVIFDQGVEINDEMVDELHDYLLSNREQTTGLLVNKLHDYALTFGAQSRIADLPHIRAVAVICYKQSSRVITELIAQLPRQHPWNLRIFDNYDEGLEWLKSEVY